MTIPLDEKGARDSPAREEILGYDIEVICNPRDIEN